MKGMKLWKGHKANFVIKNVLDKIKRFDYTNVDMLESVLAKY